MVMWIASWLISMLPTEKAMVATGSQNISPYGLNACKQAKRVTFTIQRNIGPTNVMLTFVVRITKRRFCILPTPPCKQNTNASSHIRTSFTPDVTKTLKTVSRSNP